MNWKFRRFELDLLPIHTQVCVLGDVIANGRTTVQQRPEDNKKSSKKKES